MGDHIASINGNDLTGCRHFEVARMLKEIPIGAEFTLTVVEPKKAFGEESAGCREGRGRGQTSPRKRECVVLCVVCCVLWCVVVCGAIG